MKKILIYSIGIVSLILFMLLTTYYIKSTIESNIEKIKSVTKPKCMFTSGDGFVMFRKIKNLTRI